jgi:DNA-binding CsgD family transcriptional regulator
MTVVDIVAADRFGEWRRGRSPDSLARDLVDDLGLDYFAYMTCRLPAGSMLQPEDTFRTSYPTEWVDRYRRKTYRLYDPVVQLAQHSRLPFTWGQGNFLRPYRKVQRHVFHEAKVFGIEEGYLVPVCGPDGDIGAFTVVGHQRQDIEAVVAEAAPRVQLFAAQYHDAVMNSVVRAPARPKNALSDRERECLKWTADGLTSEAVAERLALSASAVNFHLSKATRKLGASNKLHATILAVRQGLI